MNIVIAGAGRVGSDLAHSLSDLAHDVTVVDIAEEALAALGSAFDGRTVVGPAYDVGTLERAGIEGADVFVAVTDDDNANLMAVEVAKAVFGVERSIARLYDPNRETSYRALEVSHVTGTKIISRVIFEQIVEEEFTYHLTFGAGDVEIVEFVLGGGAAGVEVAALEISDALRVAAVRRANRTHIPDPDFVLEPGDFVVASARRGAAGKIRRYLAAEEQRS